MVYYFLKNLLNYNKRPMNCCQRFCQKMKMLKRVNAMSTEDLEKLKHEYLKNIK